jgi:hypothetical protein
MSWNYRVIRLTDTRDDPVFIISEVYYRDDGTPRAHCEADVSAESVEGLRRVLALMGEALEKPVLDGGTFGEVAS